MTGDGLETVPQALVALANTLADAAGQAILPYYRTSLTVESKDDDSPVTLADRAAETAMRDLLAHHRPDDGVWGEEFGQTRVDAPWVWVLDPIDGTKAFVCGKPLFTTLIGLLYHGRPVFGVIDQPVLRERWYGGYGWPTRCQDQPVRAGTCARLAQARLASTTPDMFKDGDRLACDRLVAASAQISWGGDAYNYAMLASGHVDAVLETRLKLYDFAALVPVIQSAGGVITDWRGQSLDATSAGDVLAAATPALHHQALQQLVAF